MEVNSAGTAVIPVASIEKHHQAPVGREGGSQSVGKELVTAGIQDLSWNSCVQDCKSRFHIDIPLEWNQCHPEAQGGGEDRPGGFQKQWKSTEPDSDQVCFWGHINLTPCCWSHFFLKMTDRQNPSVAEGRSLLVSKGNLVQAEFGEPRLNCRGGSCEQPACLRHTRLDQFWSPGAQGLCMWGQAGERQSSSPKGLHTPQVASTCNNTHGTGEIQKQLLQGQ
ncbi:uncharacterized protein LOC130679648 [Manis pentadactyla]|uniref:uncharacterized protein LOC130679648 n=1 Tax=Manis pentadactyla TaxID=143292 RepID=UPI00255CDE66|nr:uncharacterized protein LOC130679648 [Manis pentadactyla]